MDGALVHVGVGGGGGGMGNSGAINRQTQNPTATRPPNLGNADEVICLAVGLLGPIERLLELRQDLFAKVGVGHHLLRHLVQVALRHRWISFN